MKDMDWVFCENISKIRTHGTLPTASEQTCLHLSTKRFVFRSANRSEPHYVGEVKQVPAGLRIR